MKKTALFFLCQIIFTIFVFGQDKSYVEFDGIVEFEREFLPDATISVFEKGNSKPVITGKSDDKGKFQLALEYNKTYNIKIHKTGYVYKMIGLDTHMPEANSGRYGVGLTVELFTTCKDVDISVMDNPVVKISYDAQTNTFEPNNMYARDMSFKIMNLRQEIEECQKEDYNKLLDEADLLMKDGKYEEAIKKYEEALLMHPNEKYPKKKIDKAKEEIKDRRQETLAAAENKLDKIIDEAEAAFDNKDYKTALDKFNEALAIKPTDPYLKSRASKAQRMYDAQLEDQKQAQIQADRKAKEQAAKQEKEKAYQDAITEAKGLFEEGNYPGAIDAYKKALTVKPEDVFATSKVKEINDLIAKKEAEVQRKAQQLAAQKARDNEYNKHIAEADNQLKIKNFEQAKQSYNQASLVKPEENYPKDKIAEINRLIEQKQKAEELAKKKKELDKAYKDAITEADNLLGQKQYKEAKDTYNKALTLKPGESYPKEKVAEINNIAAEKKRKEEQQLAKDQKYGGLIATADELFEQEKYDEAKEKFIAASMVKPDEEYPKTKISEIEKILKNLALKEKERKENQAREKEYLAIIDKGNDHFEKKEYDKAKEVFNKALLQKPDDTYPKAKIDEIDKIIVRQEKDKQYDNYISQAEDFVKLERYNDAEDFYKKALEVKPNEYYPKKRLKEIDILRKDQKVAAASSKSKLKKLSFKTPAEREAYLMRLAKQYPEGITLEVYKEEFRTTDRYIIVRDNKANEFRVIKENWGGREYWKNDKPITGMYFTQQTKQREGEYFKKISK